MAGGQKLKTVHCYFGATETVIKNILKIGFKKALEGRTGNFGK